MKNSKLNLNLIIATLILATVSLVAKPVAQIVPQIVQYFDGSGRSRGGVVVQSGSLFVSSSGTGFGVGNLSIINATPTLGAGWGGSPSIPSNNASFTFKVNVGSGGVATTGTVNFNTTFTAGVNCVVQDDTNNTVTRVTSNTNSSVSVTAAAAWAANDILSFICVGF